MDKTSHSSGKNQNLQERFCIPGYEFMNFGKTTPQRGLFGVYRVPDAAGPWMTNIPPETVSRLGGGDGDVSLDYPTRPGGEQWDAELTEKDKRILSLHTASDSGRSSFRRPTLDQDGAIV